MHRPTCVSLLCLCACSSLLIQCGGPDHAALSSTGTGASSAFASGGSGNSPTNPSGGTGQSQVGEVVLLTGTTGASGFDDGPGPLGLLSYPTALVSDGTHLYIAEDYVGTLDGYLGNQVRSLDMATGIITLIAGGGYAHCQDGVGKAAGLDGPKGVIVDPSHKNLYVADGCGIRKVVIATGDVTTFAKAAYAGDNSLGDGSALWVASALAIDSKGTRLYVSDYSSRQIRVIDLSTSAMTTLAGSVTQGSADGVGSAATLCGPASLAIDPTDTKLYFADNCDNDLIRVVDIPSQQVTTIVGAANILNGDDGVGSAAGFFNLGPLAIDTIGTNLYASEGSGTRHVIRKVELASRVVTTIVGSDWESGSTDGIGTNARLNFPTGLTVVGNDLYIADSGNDKIRKFALDTTQVSTYAGSDKPATFMTR